MIRQRFLAGESPTRHLPLYRVVSRLQARPLNQGFHTIGVGIKLLIYINQSSSLRVFPYFSHGNSCYRLRGAVAVVVIGTNRRVPQSFGRQAPHDMELSAPPLRTFPAGFFRRLWVEPCLVQCNMARSAIREMIFITQEADVQIVRCNRRESARSGRIAGHSSSMGKPCQG